MVFCLTFVLLRGDICSFVPDMNFLLLYMFQYVLLVCAAVFLRSHKSLESVDPQFTMRRKMEQLREELELMEQLREVSSSQMTPQKLLKASLSR